MAGALAPLLAAFCFSCASVEGSAVVLTNWEAQVAGPSSSPPSAGWKGIATFGGLLAAPGIPKDREVDGVWYRTNQSVPEQAAERSTWLDFDHIRGIARVFIDGKFAGELVRPVWSLDVTPFVTAGKSAEVAIYVTRKGEGTTAKFADDLLMARAMRGRFDQEFPTTVGLAGEVRMEFRGRNSWLESAWVECLWKSKELRVHAKTGGSSNLDLAMSATVLDEAGQPVLELSERPFQVGEVVLSREWPDVVPWDLDKGHLYTLQVTLKERGKSGSILDGLEPIRFGFREIAVKGREVIFNGRAATFRWSPTLRIDQLHKTGDFDQADLRQLHFLKAVGFNMILVQPHPDMFWSRRNGPWPVYMREFLEEADRLGIGVSIGTLPFTSHWLDLGVTTDSQVEAQYRRELAAFIERYRNHPSILFWVGSMNYFDRDFGALANTPTHMGQNPNATQAARTFDQVISRGSEIIGEIDPTRPAYSHHGGNSGPVASSNQHLNFLPAAEIEKWPSAWAEGGDKPWVAVEFGVPYWADFWLKNRDEKSGRLKPYGEAAITEYAAMHLGNLAYELEDEELRSRLEELTRENLDGSGSSVVPPKPKPRVDGNVSDLPAVQKVYVEYARRVNRAWRTWKVTGWSPWLLSWSLRFRSDPENFMPDVVAAYRESMQPFLGYLGGAPEPYTRIWNYWAGAEIQKSANFVWDGPGDYHLKARWVAEADGKILASGEWDQTLAPGSVLSLPISLTAPETDKKCSLNLKLIMDSADGPGSADSIALTVWPKLAPSPTVQRDILLYDPAGRSGWIKSLFGEAKIVSEEAAAQADPSRSLLVLGSQSLRGMKSLPYTIEAIRNGLRVVMLEQDQADMLRLGLRSVEWVVREGVTLNSSSQMLAGLDAEDFRDWRGNGTLLPENAEFQWWSDLDSLDAWHPARGARWGTHGSVTSVAIETPQKGAFRPLVSCGFDQAYSPLLEWREQKGGIWFCQMDLSGRVGIEPAATVLARNLLTAAAAEIPDFSRVIDLTGNAPSFSGQLAALGFLVADGAATDLLQVHSLGGGGIVIGNPDVTLGGATRKITRIAANQVSTPGLPSPPPSLLRFRIPVMAQPDMEGNLFSLERKNLEVSGWLGVALTAADGPYRDAIAKDHARLSRWRLRQLYGWMFFDCRVANSPEVSGRLLQLSDSQAEKSRPKNTSRKTIPLRDVKVSQVLTSDGLEGAALLRSRNIPPPVFADYSLLAVDRTFHYGTDAAQGIHVDLSRLLKETPSSSKMAIVEAIVDLPEAQEVTVRAGFDFWGEVLLNGKPILSGTNPSGPPRRDAKRVRVVFPKGENSLTLRVVSGTKGFGYWIDLDDDASMQPISESEKIGSFPFIGSALAPYEAEGYSLYFEKMRKRDDPYTWLSW